MNAVYLASSFRQTKQITQSRAAQLRVLGIIVTCRWIDSVHWVDPLNNPAACTTYALQDLEDVDKADTLIYFAEFGTVGKNVEFGYAVARGKRIIVVGEPTSVFHFLPGVLLVPTWDALFSMAVEETRGHAADR